MSDEPVIIEIGYIIGGDEGHVLVEMLLGMFTSWADRQGLGHDLLEKAPAFGGGLMSARLRIDGACRGEFAALHQGTHTLIRIPPGQERRQMSCAGVRISEIAGMPLPGTMAEWGEERRRYMLAPYRLITDAVLGRLDLDPDMVLAGDFSGLGEA